MARRRAGLWKSWKTDVPGILVALGLLLLSAEITGFNVLYLFWTVMAVTVLVGLWVGRRNTRKVSVSLRFPKSIHAGECCELFHEVHNETRVPKYDLTVEEYLDGPLGEFMISVLVPALPAREKKTVTSAVRFPRRGVYRVREIRIRSNLPGSVVSCVHGSGKDEIVVWPAVGRLSKDFLSRLLNASGRSKSRPLFQTAPFEEEFRSVREYRHGDNPRHIHWRLSAKQGALYVREFDHPFADELILSLDLRSPGAMGEDEQERLISLAATILTVWIRQGRAAGLAGYLPTPTWIAPSSSRAHLARLMDALARAEFGSPGMSSGKVSLSPVVGKLSRHSTWLGLAPNAEDSASLRVAMQEAGARNGVLVLCVDQFEFAPPNGFVEGVQ